MIAAGDARTVTLNPLLAWRPPKSVTVQVTGVVPIAKVLPLGGTHTGVSTPCSGSLPEAVKVTTAPEGPVAFTLMFDGTVTDGAALVTVTLNVTEVVIDAMSVAEHVTTVAPIGKVEPLAGTQLTASAWSRKSVAVGTV